MFRWAIRFSFYYTLCARLILSLSYQYSGMAAVSMEVINYIAIPVSLLLLFVAFWILFCFKRLQSNMNSIHINLIFNVFIAELTFLIGIDKVNDEVSWFILRHGIFSSNYKYFSHFNLFQGFRYINFWRMQTLQFVNKLIIVFEFLGVFVISYSIAQVINYFQHPVFLHCQWCHHQFFRIRFTAGVSSCRHHSPLFLHFRLRMDVRRSTASVSHADRDPQHQPGLDEVLLRRGMW